MKQGGEGLSRNDTGLYRIDRRARIDAEASSGSSGPRSFALSLLRSQSDDHRDAGDGGRGGAHPCVRQLCLFTSQRRKL